jgi:Transposase zinc-ribbon domain
MARNPVQFQKGMSLAAFQAEYGGKESCEAALRAQRWPQDFVCPKCHVWTAPAVQEESNVSAM